MAGVIATCGKTCSGKSRYARELQRISGGVILSCDEITLMFPGAEHGRILPLVKQYLLKKSLPDKRNLFISKTCNFSCFVLY